MNAFGFPTLFDRHAMTTGLMLLAGYVTIHIASHAYMAHGSGVVPALSIGIAFLYFQGWRNWPLLLLVILIAELIVTPAPTAVGLSLVYFGTAASGAYLLSHWHLDPIFRRKHDAFVLLRVCALIAAILPAGFYVIALSAGHAVTALELIELYVGNALTLLIFTSFLMRWIVKPGFKRTRSETIEILTVFGVLGVICSVAFLVPLSGYAQIIAMYAVALPLFWIALRMRPRFVTLSLVLLFFFVMGGKLLNPTLDTVLPFLHTDLILLFFAVTYLIIATQEEDRRANQNLAKSQLLSLENALVRINNESKAKEDFIAVLAHELRNPLSPVVSTIEYLKLKGDRDPEESEALDIIDDRMKTMQRLLEDLLDVSQIIEGKTRLDMSVIDLLGAIKASIISTEHYRSERHQALDIHAPAQPIWITGDRVRIEQVFTNLLSNASKYSPSGDTTRLDIELKDQSVIIHITDHGNGLSPDSLERIFQPFQQVASKKKPVQGLGIGLALVRSFVELHGGTVVAESPGIGRGSTFTVTLPLADAAPQTTERPAPTVPKTASPRKTLILIADDNDAAAASLGRLLEVMKYRVAFAYDGHQAIKHALELSPAAVLLDINMPGKSGHEVATTLRARHYAGKIIALSGYGKKDVEQAYGAVDEFDEYLVKPISAQVLRDLLPEP